MAKSAKGKVSNFFVWIILILLIVGLAGFGVSNFGGSVRSVATVGETEIDVGAYARALQTELRTLSEAEGSAVTMAEARARGIDGRVLQGLLANAALDEAARLAGLSVGDAAVSEQILQIPGFQGVDGSFDRDAYRFALDQNGLSVAQFEEQIRSELARNLLQAALTAGLSPGPAFGDAVYSFLTEGRTLSVAPLTEEILDAPVAPPTPEEIAAYYEANPEPFTLPERRAITYAWLTPEMLAERIEIDAAALRAAYDARADEFRRPERRMVDRLAFPDEAAAQAAADAIAAGETSFAALLEERGLNEGDVDLGILAARDLGEAAEGVFALEDTGVAGPLPSPVGPALFRVNAILSAQETSFEAARESLRRDLALERASAVIVDEFEPLQDLLAGGATLEELAAETDMELGRIDWTGAEDTGVAAYATFADLADSVGVNDFPEIVPLEDGGIVALRLDEVIPAELQPLDAVQEQARGLAAQDKRDTALAARAEALLPDLNGGAAFEAVGLIPAVFEAVSRRAMPPGLAPEVAEAAFAMEVLETRIVQTADGPVVVRLDAIVPPPADDPAAQAVQAAVTQEAAAGMARDVLTAVARAIEAEAGITVNSAAINAVQSQLP